jgi:hypothetical protein
MPVNPISTYSLLHHLKYCIFLCLLAASCTIPKKYQKGKPFITKNNIEVKGGNFSKEERATLRQRLNAQLDDSSRINVIDKYFIRHIIISPPAYDSNSAAQSARNMETSMLHLGYYKAKAGFTADTVTVGEQRVASDQELRSSAPVESAFLLHAGGPGVKSLARRARALKTTSSGPLPKHQ